MTESETESENEREYMYDLSLNKQGTEKRKSGGSPDSPDQAREPLLYFSWAFSLGGVFYVCLFGLVVKGSGLRCIIIAEFRPVMVFGLSGFR